MTREFIQEIFDRITAELPEILAFGLFNDNFEKQNDGVKSGLKFPALFVSFPEGCTYLNNVSGVQRSEDFIVRFHIGTKHSNDDDILDVFDLKEKIYRTFHKWQPVNASTFSRISEIPDELRGNFYVFEQDFTTNLVAPSKFIENGRVPVTLIPSISPNLNIAQSTVETLRTDK